MPFDFSTPGEAPPANPPGGFDLSGQPAPLHDSGVTPPQQHDDGFGSVPPPEQQGFYQPDVPHGPDPLLPVPASSIDGDALKQEVFAAISSVLVDLSQELKRSLDYYKSRTGDAPIHEVLLVGGTAKLRGLTSYLETSLDNVPTRLGDPLQFITVVSRQMSEEKLQDVASLFPVSIGLGARNLMAAPSKNQKR